MRNYSVDAYLEAGSFPELSLLCYSVSWESGTRRTLTRYSEGDILSEYIDIDSIHAEWAYDSSDIFQPGGIIPVSLSFRILPGHGLSMSTVLSPSFCPKSAADYSYLFRPQIKLKRTGYIDYFYPFPYMILKETKRDRGDYSAYKLYFEDETCVFEYMNYDIGDDFGSVWQLIVRRILSLSGQGGSNDMGISGTYSLPGTSYYQGDSMSARKVLSYIAQMNGVFMTRDNNSRLKVVPMLDAGEASSGNFPYVLDGEVSTDYVVDTYNEDIKYKGYTYRNAYVVPYNSTLPGFMVNNPIHYIAKGNPFIVTDNSDTYNTILRERVVKKLDYSGVVINCRYNPNFEIGDYILFRQREQLAITSQAISVARIVWDGGAFCTVYGARFGVDNR